MREFLQELKRFFRKGDIVLLVISLFISAFGCLIVASTNNYREQGFLRYVLVQVAAIGLGVVFYAVFSSIDLEFFSEHRRALMVFCLAMLALLIPFGTDLGSGNKSWLSLPLVPFYIQPAEICKIFYILVAASVMNSHQHNLSSFRSVFHMGYYLILLVGTNVLLSEDVGVSLIFIFIFLGMAFSGGVKLWWFLLGGGLIGAAWPFVWNYFLDNYQKLRIESLYNPDIDPMGTGVRYHLQRSLDALTGGGVTGQGLFNGNRIQAGALPAQHTDFIFSAIGEELGYIGCFLVLVMLFILVARCIWVGRRSPDYMRRLVCFGAAAALIFQVFVNIGMCIGVVPVIGLTLPLISYGGSSTVTIYAMLGLVSGVYARPAPRSHERYVRPPR
ncbi:MAG: cell division protein FtsW [Ruminococcaceae bacterium]|nr:cell division protein FtsW [Oscillospiraceae bacterium]